MPRVVDLDLIQNIKHRCWRSNARHHIRTSSCCSGGGSGGGGGATNEREEARTTRRFLFVEKQILRHPERAVSTHDPHPNHPGRYEQRPHAREKDHDHRDRYQADESFEVRERAAHDDEGLIGRPERVEEEPGGEEGEEDYEGERVGEE